MRQYIVVIVYVNSSNSSSQYEVADLLCKLAKIYIQMI